MGLLYYNGFIQWSFVAYTVLHGFGYLPYRRLPLGRRNLTLVLIVSCSYMKLISYMSFLCLNY
jgi:hypothetical protein